MIVSIYYPQNTRTQYLYKICKELYKDIYTYSPNAEDLIDTINGPKVKHYDEIIILKQTIDAVPIPSSIYAMTGDSLTKSAQHPMFYCELDAVKTIIEHINNLLLKAVIKCCPSILHSDEHNFLSQEAYHILNIELSQYIYKDKESRANYIENEEKQLYVEKMVANRQLIDYIVIQ